MTVEIYIARVKIPKECDDRRCVYMCLCDASGEPINEGLQSVSVEIGWYVNGAHNEYLVTCFYFCPNPFFVVKF